MKTGKEILKSNDKLGAQELLKRLKDENIPFKDPKLHAKLLGVPYNKGDFENDDNGAIQRLMTELKILSIFGKHTCPEILLK